MIEKITQIFKVPDLRKKIIFTLLILVLFRFAAHIPVPGVDLENLKEFFQGNQFFGLLDIFSGGGMSSFSIIMMGIAPYINASIIMQLLTMVIPKLEAIQKEGEDGQRKINRITRYLTVPLAAMQSYGMITVLNQSSQPIINDLNPFRLVTIIITITAGTVFLMWLGELVTEKGIGNGISLLIFAGIISRVPSAIKETFAVADAGQILSLFLFGAIAVVVVFGVVIITEGQRNIPISYARRVQGNRLFGGVSTHLPLRVNQAGVIPIIFAISIMLFPGMIANFFVNAQTAWLASGAQSVANLFQNQLFYGVLYFVMVVLFTYFYTAVVFNPDNIAENVQKQGGFVPGIRPGKNTAEYLKRVLNRITLAGALFLGAIAVLPLAIQGVTNIQTLTLGGTGLLIVVSVVIETMKQIESQLVMRDYEGF
ncbi:preprotein translocase subunit SecY [Patescibacteria group bacterium]